MRAVKTSSWLKDALIAIAVASLVALWCYGRTADAGCAAAWQQPGATYASSSDDLKACMDKTYASVSAQKARAGITGLE